MTKNYMLFLLLTLFMGFVNAQTTITHSTTQTITPLNTIACPTEPTAYLRVFDLANDFSMTEDFEISQLEFGVEVSESGPILVKLYTSTGLDPFNSTLTNIYIGSVPVGVADEGSVVSHTLSTSVTVPASTILVMELIESVDEIVFRVGSNQDGQTGPSWLGSGACGFGTVESFGYVNNYVMNIVGNVLGIEEFSSDNVSIYPNPVNNVVNIQLHNSIKVNKAIIYSITGQVVLDVQNQTKIDVSYLNSGIYLLKIVTDNGSITRKIVKN